MACTLGPWNGTGGNEESVNRPVVPPQCHDMPSVWKVMMNQATRTLDRDRPRRSLAAAGLCLAMLAGCDESPTSPSDSALVTIGVVNETFRVQVVGERQISAARAAQAGGPARIPNGRIVSGAGINTGYGWHLEDVEFVEVAIPTVRRPPVGCRAAGRAIRRRTVLPVDSTRARHQHELSAAEIR